MTTFDCREFLKIPSSAEYFKNSKLLDISVETVYFYGLTEEIIKNAVIKRKCEILGIDIKTPLEEINALFDNKKIEELQKLSNLSIDENRKKSNECISYIRINEENFLSELHTLSLMGKNFSEIIKIAYAEQFLMRSIKQDDHGKFLKRKYEIFMFKKKFKLKTPHRSPIDAPLEQFIENEKDTTHANYDIIFYVPFFEQYKYFLKLESGSVAFENLLKSIEKHPNVIPYLKKRERIDIPKESDFLQGESLRELIPDIYSALIDFQTIKQYDVSGSREKISNCNLM